MAYQIKISDYFRMGDNRALTDFDWKQVKAIRRKLDSFKDEYDMQEWIFHRRETAYNRQEDYRLFGIPLDGTINQETWMHRDNSYYDESSAQGRKYDYNKRDRHGHLKYNRDGSVQQYGKLGKAGINFANNMKNSKLGKAAQFVVKNFHAIMIAVGVASAMVALVTMIFYVGGVASSVGQTPFVLCGEGGDVNKIAGKFIQKMANNVATPEYACKVFIKVAKDHNWKDNAIIGTLSYILQEGSGMGTFTYEGYYCYNGPSGHLRDKTINNQQWVDWINNEGKEQAHVGYYAEHTRRYAAIGIGLIQSSDVWNSDGSVKEVSNATNYIDYCQGKGVAWQDPMTQMEYLFETQFSKSTAFDTSDVDPTTSDLTPEEWCARVTCGIGMPAYTWGTYDEEGNPVINDNKYVQDHVRHVAEATMMFEQNKGGDFAEMTFMSQTFGGNLCESSYGFLSGGNATIADAAVSLASGAGPEGKIEFDMHGSSAPALQLPQLATYKKVHEQYYPGDIYFASCDRSSACAIRWSGADPNFPAGACRHQLQYMQSHPEIWQYVGMSPEVWDELRPGDVLCNNGHIKIYVGNEAVRKRFPDSDANIYQGSYENYYPYVRYETWDYDTDPNYYVFRNVPQNGG